MKVAKIFAFIFARGGSKGLPGKNIKELGGIPLLAHSIRLARSMNCIQEVFVSTDSKEISEVARRFGATVIERPAELASDTASEWLAWQHAIDHVCNQKGLNFDAFLSLPATSPLRNQDDVQACLDALDDNCDVVITVSPSSRSPYFNMISINENDCAQIVLDVADFKCRQDVPVVYDITTVAYVARPEFILKNERIFAGRVKPVIVPKERAVDIDDEIDFKIAQALYIA